MTTGDKVQCISSNFPWIEKYGGTSKRQITPKKGDVLIIDEVLCDFLRFDLFDSEDSFNWWHKSRFRKLSFTQQEEKEHEYNLQKSTM